MLAHEKERGNERNREKDKEEDRIEEERSVDLDRVVREKGGRRVEEGIGFDAVALAGGGGLRLNGGLLPYSWSSQAS